MVKLKSSSLKILTLHVQISPSDVLAPRRPGRRVVILGDTCDSSDMIPIARGADLVVHEATNENAHEVKCQENGHSTPSMFYIVCTKRAACSYCHSLHMEMVVDIICSHLLCCSGRQCTR